MLEWAKLQSQIEAMSDYLAERPKRRADALLKAQRELLRMAYGQRGVPVLGEFCVITEGQYARERPAEYAEFAEGSQVKED